MTETTLEKARRRYPLGSLHVPLDHHGNADFSISEVEREHRVCDSGNIDCGVGYIYVAGKWAPRIFDIPEHGSVEIHGDIHDDVLYMLKQSPRIYTDGKNGTKYQKYLAWNDTSYWYCTKTSKQLITSLFEPVVNTTTSVVTDSTPTTALIPVTKYVQGLRVQRGPDWTCDDQDGGAGKLGTVIDNDTSKGWVKVKWDSRDRPNSYEIGAKGKYSLALVDPNDAHLLQDKPIEQFHNPDNLTPEQVGEGYRLLYTSELHIRGDSYKSIQGWQFPVWSDINYYGSSESVIYRVPACFPKDFTEEYIKEYESVNKSVKPINSSKNEKHTENRSAVLQSIDLKVGQGSISRGVGLKGSVSKIRFGNHSSNYQERLGCS